MRAGDSYSATNFTASQGPFNLRGGKYGVILTAGTWGSGGTITIQINNPNGVPVPVAAGSTANAYATIEVPPCTGTVAVSGTITGGAALISRIPGE